MNALRLTALVLALAATGCNRDKPLCFAPDASIATPSGPRPIAALRPGDEVLGRDGRARPIASLPRWRHAGEVVALQVDGAPALEVTRNHLVATPGGLVRADRLRAGDAVLGLDGPRPLVRAERRRYRGEVLNVVVEGGHVVAAGIVVTALDP